MQFYFRLVRLIRGFGEEAFAGGGLPDGVDGAGELGAVFDLRTAAGCVGDHPERHDRRCEDSGE